MTETRLAELVVQGESDTLEFKKTTAQREATMKSPITDPAQALEWLKLTGPAFGKP